MKSDARVRLTKRLLREALLECMKSKQLKDITITEVCGRAEVNRATFYKHYKSCYDIVDEVEQEQLEMFRAMLVEKKKAGEALLRDILVSVDRAVELTGGEAGQKLPESFRDGLIRTAAENGVSAWKERIPNVDDREAEIVYEGFLAAALRMALLSDGSEREATVRNIMGMFNGYIESHTDHELLSEKTTGEATK